MLRSQEVKLVVSLLFIHQGGQELTTISGDKLGSQFDNIAAQRKSANILQALANNLHEIKKGLCE